VRLKSRINDERSLRKPPRRTSTARRSTCWRVDPGPDAGRCAHRVGSRATDERKTGTGEHGFAGTHRIIGPIGGQASQTERQTLWQGLKKENPLRRNEADDGKNSRAALVVPRAIVAFDKIRRLRVREVEQTVGVGGVRAQRNPGDRRVEVRRGFNDVGVVRRADEIQQHRTIRQNRGIRDGRRGHHHEIYIAAADHNGSRATWQQAAASHSDGGTSRTVDAAAGLLNELIGTGPQLGSRGIVHGKSVAVQRQRALRNDQGRMADISVERSRTERERNRA